MSEEIRYLDVPLTVASLKPGDVIVAHIPTAVPPGSLSHLQRVMEETFPGHKVIVCLDGLRIEVVSPEDPTDLESRVATLESDRDHDDTRRRERAERSEVA